MSSRGRTLALGTLMVVATLGVATHPGMRSEPSDPAPALEPQREPALVPSAPPPVTTGARRAVGPDAALPPGAAESGVRPELLARHLAGDLTDPARAVQLLLDDMTDAELRSALFELTNLDARDLADVPDLREYSTHLAAIAMGGVVLPSAPEAEPVAEVLFSRTVDEVGAPLQVGERFAGDPQDRIYAHFPTEGYAGDRVLVKWFREGDPRSLLEELLGGAPRMLLFARYPVQRGDSVSYVWLSRDREWEPGRYRVELYEASEPLRKLAAGRFVISKEQNATAPAPG